MKTLIYERSFQRDGQKTSIAFEDMYITISLSENGEFSILQLEPHRVRELYENIKMFKTYPLSRSKYVIDGYTCKSSHHSRFSIQVDGDMDVYFRGVMPKHFSLGFDIVNELFKIIEIFLS